jgi:hypothetical protein
MSAMQTSHGEIASAIEGFRVGIDLGGSKIEGVLMGPQGTELARHRVTTPRDGIVRLTNHEQASRRPSRLSRGELTPFRECGRAVLFENVARVEVAVVVEMVVD